MTSMNYFNQKLSPFFKGSILVLAGLFIGKLLAMANNVILARYLHAHDYGVILLGLSLFELANVPASSGVPSLLPKFIAEFRSKNQFNSINDIFLISLGSCLILSFLIAILVILSSNFISTIIFKVPELQSVLRILVFSIPLTVSSAIIISMFRGYELVKPRVFIQDILFPLLKILAFYFLFYFGLKLSAAYWSFLLANMVVFIFLLILLQKTFTLKFRFKVYTPDMNMHLIRLAWPMSLQSLLVIIYSQIDRVCLGYFLPPHYVGIYGAAYSITSMLIIIPMAFNYLALPKFSNSLSEGNIKTFKSDFHEISHTIYLISLPVCITVIIFARNLLMVLYGKEYVLGETVLWILTVGIFSNCIIGPAADALVALGKTRAPLYAAIAGCITNIILNIILIPILNMEGAAIATCISMYVSKAVLGILNYMQLKVIPFDMSYIHWLSISVCLAILVFYLSRRIMTDHYFFQTLVLGSSYIISNFIIFHSLKSQKSSFPATH